MALLAGGRFSALGGMPIRRTELVFLGFALQVGVLYLGKYLPGLHWLSPVLHIAAYVVIVYALAANCRLPGVSVILLGTLMNFLVIAANGGHMPVAEMALVGAGLDAQVEVLRTGGRATHMLLEQGARLGFFADVYHMKAPLLPPSCFSIGDVLMAIGVFVVVFQGMMGRCGSRPRHAKTRAPFRSNLVRRRERRLS